MGRGRGRLVLCGCGCRQASWVCLRWFLCGAWAICPRERDPWDGEVLRRRMRRCHRSASHQRRANECPGTGAGEHRSREFGAVASDERTCDAAQDGRGSAQEDKVGACGAEKAPRQQEECGHPQRPHDERFGVLWVNGWCESGEVQGVEDGQRRANQPEESVRQVFLPMGSA